jgi:uncharacterized protein YbcC (UPF0753/DUF2309 family)
MTENIKKTNDKVLPFSSEDSDQFINEYIVKDSFLAASKKLSPLWDIRDYVAVNPFFGFRDESFLDTAKYMRGISSRDITPKREYFLKQYNEERITDYDIEVAKSLYKKESNRGARVEISTQELLDFIQKDTNKELTRRINCISDSIDANYDIETDLQGDIGNLITNEVSKWSSAYFDEGQSIWKISTQGERLFSWWKNLAQLDAPFKNTKINDNFKSLLKNLPNDPEQALETLTAKLLTRCTLKASDLTDYYYRLIYTTMGWSSYLQKFEFESSRSGDDSKLREVGGLIDIVVMRMSYDIALLNESNDQIFLVTIPKRNINNTDLDCSYIWLNAAENAYRRTIKESLEATREVRKTSTQEAEVQMAFCIDVRSEILRRHLENASPKIQTIGFAGFFGMPISLKGLGHTTSDQNCPILLNSAYEIQETTHKNCEKLSQKKKDFSTKQYLVKQVQSSANSGFSFVETLGFTYIGKMMRSGFGLRKPNMDLQSMGLAQDDKDSLHLNLEPLSLEQKVTLASGALKNMGLRNHFAQFVFFFGHGSESSNNPYASALDCGACAGHNGLGNAQMLASLLNDTSVRKELSSKGFEIPNSTVFLSGQHNTTKDELIIDSLKDLELTQEQNEKLEAYRSKFIESSKSCQRERAQKLSEEFNSKANDWSEIRPEWGLARNASFIVAKRQLTRGLSTDGRSFLHDYNHETDTDLSVLELIMTAPMIVTNWINMQYYASTVDPLRFGAGNKVLNNVVGGIGCVQGNGGDLLGGLTEQSVWYKGDYFHEPIRLQVFIQAETNFIDQIIQKHPMVQELLDNNWLKIIAINPINEEFKLYQSQEWIDTKEDLWS